MSAQYSIQRGTTPSQAGKYFMRVEPNGTIRKEQIIKNIASKTLVGPVDIEAVLDALSDEIVDGLINGNTVLIDNFFSFSLSLNAAITDPNYTIQLPGDEISTMAQFKNAIRDRVRQLLPDASHFEKVTTRVRAPQINRVFDTLTKQVGKYSSGAPIEITGADLDLPQEIVADPRNGMFFTVWQEAWVLVLIGLTQGLSILVAIPCLRLLVFFVPGSATLENQVPPARSGSKQVALRDLLLWVAAAACLLGALRFLKPDTLPGSAYTVISIRGIGFALVGLTVYWAMVGRRQFSLRVVTVAFVAPLSGAIASWCTFLSRPPGDPGWRWFALMTTLQAAFTAAMLTLWRGGGHPIERDESFPDRSNLQAEGSPVAP